MQKELEQEKAQPLASSPPVNTKLWWKQDVNAFVNAFHSIKAKGA